MRKAIIMFALCMTGLMLTAGTAWSEEAAWYDAAENWILRVYTAPSGADYSVTLEVLDTGNNLVTDRILGMTTNPFVIAGNAGGPDVSLAFDEGSATAYVIYTAGGGGVMLQPVPDIVRARGAIGALPSPLSFGYVVETRVRNRMVTISNTGNVPANITSIGTPGGPFSIVAAGSTCAAGTMLGVGASCSIMVSFVPPGPATYTGSFGITSDAGNATVNLTGQGETAMEAFLRLMEPH